MWEFSLLADLVSSFGRNGKQWSSSTVDVSGFLLEDLQLKIAIPTSLLDAAEVLREGRRRLIQLSDAIRAVYLSKPLRRQSDGQALRRRLVSLMTKGAKSEQEANEIRANLIQAVLGPEDNYELFYKIFLIAKEQIMSMVLGRGTKGNDIPIKEILSRVKSDVKNITSNAPTLLHSAGHEDLAGESFIGPTGLIVTSANSLEQNLRFIFV